MPVAPAFQELLIASVHEVTPELVHLELGAVPAAVQRAYTVPGQYVQIQEGVGKPGFFAIACGPSKGKLEFLIKRGHPVADAIAAQRSGQALLVSAPAGKGFPMQEARGKDLFLFAVGSGLSPVRAVVHEVIRERSNYGEVKLFYGVRQADGFPYADEFDAWQTHRVEVTRTCSRPNPGTWQNLTGHVQDVFRQHQPRVAPDTCVFVCGMQGMVEGVKAAVQELGLSPGRVFQNF